MLLLLVVLVSTVHPDHKAGHAHEVLHAGHVMREMREEGGV